MTVSMVLDHLYIVIFAVIITIIVGVPIGIAAYMFKPARRAILVTVELLQTIPAMALLGIIMVFLGAGKSTVVVGLLLYSLLPVVQNTYLGLSEIDPGIKEVAMGMGMARLYQLVNVEIPTAFPLIFAGIRIATVTSVGVAVFASFVGGGGIGSAIYRGIRVGNMPLIFQSTLTLMVMAVGFDMILAFFERKLQRKFSPR